MSLPRALTRPPAEPKNSSKKNELKISFIENFFVAWFCPCHTFFFYCSRFVALEAIKR